jgi:hypothetical protein
VVARGEEDLVRAINQMVVREGLEELYGFPVVAMPASSRFGLAGSVDRNIFRVPLPKGIPKLAVGSRVPGIV